MLSQRGRQWRKSFRCEMLAAAERAGVIHALGAEFRFDSAQALLTRIVRSGAIGDPLMFHRIYQQPGGDPNEPLADWWLDADQGGGFLGAFGTHMMDQARNTVGEFAAVSAILRKLSPGRPTQARGRLPCRQNCKTLRQRPLRSPN